MKFSKNKTIKNGLVELNIFISPKANDFLAELCSTRYSEGYNLRGIVYALDDITEFLQKEKSRFNSFCSTREHNQRKQPQITDAERQKMLEQIKREMIEEIKREIKNAS